MEAPSLDVRAGSLQVSITLPAQEQTAPSIPHCTCNTGVMGTVISAAFTVGHNDLKKATLVGIKLPEISWVFKD